MEKIVDTPVVGVGADAAGYAFKEAVRQHLLREHEVIDFGVRSDDDTVAYPTVAVEAARAIVAGRIQRAILVCGTGLGMAISANKVAGVRAAVAYDSYSVERSVLSNNCQVLALGARVIGVELGLRICDQWLQLCFDPGSPSARKLDVLSGYETGSLPAAG
jgi:ribose 5-phosphate isomerase B